VVPFPCLACELGLLGVPLLVLILEARLMPVAESAMLSPQLDAFDGLTLS
jgi:hypothetical protein